MTTVLQDIVKPIEAVVEGKQPDHVMGALAFMVASVFYQAMMPRIAEQEVFNNAMNLFRKQVGEDLVMLIEANKEPK